MSVKVDWSKLGDVEVDKYKVRARSSFNFVPAAEYKRRLMDDGFGEGDVDLMLQGVVPHGFLTKSCDARSATSHVVPFHSNRHMSVEAARSYTPDDVGYCYLRMVVRKHWARIASILGPDPRLVRVVSVVGADFAVDELRKLEFVKIEGVLHHIRYGDGTAYEVLRRSLRFFSGTPSIVRDVVGVSMADGYAIPMNAKLGGTYTVDDAFNVSDNVIEENVMSGKVKIPLVYMTGDSTGNGRANAVDNGVIESQSSVVCPTDVPGASCSEKIYSMGSVSHPSMVILPADVSVSSGGSVVGGKGDPVALIVPARQSISAHKLVSVELCDQSYNMVDTSLRLRSVKLSEEWRANERVARSVADARFAVSDTDFYVARHYDKWKGEHQGAAVDQVEITDPYDYYADVRTVRRTCSVQCGVVGDVDAKELGRIVKVSNLRSEFTQPVAITLNSVITLVDPGGVVAIDVGKTDTLGVLRADGHGKVSYHMSSVVDTCGYDTAHSSPVIWPSGDIIGDDCDFDDGLSSLSFSSLDILGE